MYFTNTERIAPYVSAKEYVSYDKISSFEVNFIHISSSL